MGEQGNGYCCCTCLPYDDTFNEQWTTNDVHIGADGADGAVG